MTSEWLQRRQELLFDTPPAEFAAACERYRRQAAAEYAAAGLERQAVLAGVVAELAIDLQSYLPRWRLCVPGDAQALAPAAVEREAAGLEDLLREWRAEDLVRLVRARVDGLRRSNWLRLSQQADTGALSLRWGYDYASGIAAAMRRGAMLVTTNPPLVNMARKENAGRWRPVRAELRAANRGATAERLASLFAMQVVLDNARILRPLHQATAGRYGYVNLQVNPHHAHDADRMAEEAEFLHERLTAELGGTPNVVFKLPGTRAALQTAARLTGQGIGVTITLGFSVDQHAAFAAAIEPGRAPVSFLVMMNGRLDDPIRDELQAGGLADAAEVARWASTAIVRRSYRNLFVDGSFRRSSLLVASLRGPWNVEGAIADGPAPLFLTSFPDKTEEYDAEPRPLVCHMRDEVPAGTMAKLRRSRLFCQAYDVGGLTVDGFDTYHPVAVTLAAFTQAYDELSVWLGGTGSRTP